MIIEWLKNRNKDAYVGAWTAFRLNGQEYRKRFCGAAKYLALYALIITLVAGVIAGLLFVVPGEDNPMNAFKSAISSATGLASPIGINNEGVHANTGIKDNVVAEDSAGLGDDTKRDPDSGVLTHFDWWIFSLIILEAFVVAFIGMLFSGAFAAVFLRPINPIKVAPFAILSPESLSMRFWVCYPSGKFLHNVTVSLRFAYDRSYRSSILQFSGKAGEENPLLIQKESYTMLRGVWDISLPMGSDNSKKLRDALGSEDHPSAKIQLLIQGETDSGEYVDKSCYIKIQDILTDYVFASYHCPIKAKEGFSLKQRKRMNRLWFSNFPKVVSIEAVKERTRNSIPVVNVNERLLEETDLELKALKSSKDGSSSKNWSQEAPVEESSISKEEDYEEWCSAINRSLKNGRVTQYNKIEKYSIEPASEWDPYLNHEDRVLISKM